MKGTSRAQGHPDYGWMPSRRAWSFFLNKLIANDEPAQSEMRSAVLSLSPSRFATRDSIAEWVISGPAIRWGVHNVPQTSVNIAPKPRKKPEPPRENAVRPGSDLGGRLKTRIPYRNANVCGPVRPVPENPR